MLKRLLMIVMFIASVTQAMATVIMPYNMPMPASNAMPMHSMMVDCNEPQMPAQQTTCDNELDCCSDICSLAFIPYATFLSSIQPASVLSLDIQRQVITTQHTLYRPPMDS